MSVATEPDRNQITLAPGTGIELTIPSSALIEATIESTHSALSTWRATTHLTPDLDTYADIAARAVIRNRDGTRVFTGEVVSHEPTEDVGGETVSVIEGHCRLFSTLKKDMPDNPFVASGDAHDVLQQYFNDETAWDVSVREPDGTPRTVDVELSDTHLDNVQTLLQRANYVFAPEHKSPDLVGDAFERGSETREPFWEIPNRSTASTITRSGDRRQYANVIRAKGDTDDNGDRIIAEAEDTDEIDRLLELGASQDQARRVDVVRNPGASQSETEAAAESELERRVQERQDEVRLSGPGILPRPGYAYDVKEADSAPTLEEVSFRIAEGSETGELSFSQLRSPSRDLAALRQDVTRLQDVI